jgi:predicted RNA-binding Zn-ribbon protein involved in translation (DUF1610 family)
MAAAKCDNCGDYTYSSSYSTRSVGFGLMFLVPLIVGGAASYTYISDDMIVFLTLGSASIGLLVVIYSFIFRQKTIEWSCSKCGFRQTHDY